MVSTRVAAIHRKLGVHNFNSHVEIATNAAESIQVYVLQQQQDLDSHHM